MAEIGPEKAKRKASRTAWGPGNPPPKSPGRPKKGPPREVAVDASLPPQLGAMRAAASWPHKADPNVELVRFYVEMKRNQPQSFSRQWERLEKEYAKDLPAAPQPVLPPSGASVPVPVSPAVEEDPVGEKLEAMIEAWLAETGKRVAGTCPCCGQKVKEKP